MPHPFTSLESATRSVILECLQTRLTLWLMNKILVRHKLEKLRKWFKMLYSSASSRGFSRCTWASSRQRPGTSWRGVSWACFGRFCGYLYVLLTLFLYITGFNFRVGVFSFFVLFPFVFLSFEITKFHIEVILNLSYAYLPVWYAVTYWNNACVACLWA